MLTSLVKEFSDGKLEEQLRTQFDIVTWSPPTRFTKLIELKGKVLYEA